MTEENLSEYSILSESGEVSAIYKDKTVVLPILLDPESGTITFNLTNVDMEQKRLRLLEAENAKIKVSLDASLEAIDYLLLGDTAEEAEV